MFDERVVADVLARKTITADDVLSFRRSVYGDGIAVPGEIDRLFAIDEGTVERDPSWRQLFVEVGTDYLVDQVEPRGYVSEENADWLMSRIGRDDVVKTGTELELLVRVLEKAQTSPERLVAFALKQVKRAVLSGDGPLADGGRLTPGKVDEAEVELVRRIIFAFGGDGHVAITRSEAEVLFDINDATAEADNDPSWSDLFVKAIANFMMAASGYEVPTRQEALRRDAFLDSRSVSVADFFSRMAGGGLHGVLDAYRRPNLQEAWAERNAKLRAAIATSEVITAGEAEWLAGRIGKDGQMHANEKALLRFIHDEAPSVHPSLRLLIDKAA